MAQFGKWNPINIYNRYNFYTIDFSCKSIILQIFVAILVFFINPFIANIQIKKSGNGSGSESELLLQEVVAITIKTKKTVTCLKLIFIVVGFKFLIQRQL